MVSNQSKLTTFVFPIMFTDETREDQFVRFANLLTYETLGKLNYLHATLTETLRLFPSVPLVILQFLNTL